MENVLELRNVSKNFPGVKALDNMSLSLKRGEVHAVCGENGAGKSTLMKIITGVYHADEGDILLHGERATFNNTNEAYDKGIAIIYQETSLFPEMTILENLFLGHEITKSVCSLKVIDYKAMREKAKSVFKRLGLELDQDMLVKNLSVAAMQMVEIAKSLTFDANVLIMDEPTAALTNREVETLFGIIRNLRQSGISILYISHRLEEIFEMADRVTVMRDGQYVATADVDQTNTNEVISWMIGRDLSNLYYRTETNIGECVLELEGLCQEGVLHDIDLQLHRGEILGLAGLAGSGRTELALAIAGFTQPSAGTIRLDSEKAHIKNYASSLRKGIVYVSEDRKSKGLVIEMSVSENVTMSIMKVISNGIFVDESKEKAVADGYISKLSIKTPSEDFIVENLSGGNQQKVSVAKALATKPKVLILDEPTRGVDVGAKVEIHKIIDSLAHSGIGIILISSDLPEVLGMSDQVYVLKDGRISGKFSRAEASPHAVLSVAL